MECTQYIDSKCHKLNSICQYNRYLYILKYKKNCSMHITINTIHIDIYIHNKSKAGNYVQTMFLINIEYVMKLQCIKTYFENATFKIKSCLLFNCALVFAVLIQRYKSQLAIGASIFHTAEVGKSGRVSMKTLPL